MKISKVVGIDIGEYRMKVSYVVKGRIKEFFYENVPDNAVKAGTIQFWDATGQFIRETLKAHGIRCKNVVFSIPVSGVYIRKVELPLMTVKQLEINLPFEFHDYISENTDKYFYDYAVVERNEKTMQVLAVACSKEIINKYRNLAREVKLVPCGLVPDVIGIQRVIEKYNQIFSVPEGKDYAVLDMGDQSFKLHFFKDGVYDVTRNLEPGGISFAKTVAEINGTDIHIARISLEDNVMDIQDHPKLLQMYESRAVEIMRALNFYSYSNTTNTIDTLYFYGGSGTIVSFIRVLQETLNIPVKTLGNLAITNEGKIRQHFNYSPQCFGVTVNPEADVFTVSEKEISEIMEDLKEYEKAEKERYGSRDGDRQQAEQGTQGEPAGGSSGSGENREEGLHRLNEEGELSGNGSEAEPGLHRFADGRTESGLSKTAEASGSAGLSGIRENRNEDSLFATRDEHYDDISGSSYNDSDLIGLNSFLDSEENSDALQDIDSSEKGLFRFEDHDEGEVEPDAKEDYETLKSIEELAAQIENGHKGQ